MGVGIFSYLPGDSKVHDKFDGSRHRYSGDKASPEASVTGCVFTSFSRSLLYCLVFLKLKFRLPSVSS